MFICFFITIALLNKQFQIKLVTKQFVINSCCNACDYINVINFSCGSHKIKASYFQDSEEMHVVSSHRHISIVRIFLIFNIRMMK